MKGDHKKRSEMTHSRFCLSLDCLSGLRMITLQFKKFFWCVMIIVLGSHEPLRPSKIKAEPKDKGNATRISEEAMWLWDELIIPSWETHFCSLAYSCSVFWVLIHERHFPWFPCYTAQPLCPEFKQKKGDNTATSQLLHWHELFRLWFGYSMSVFSCTRSYSCRRLGF